MNHLNVFSVYFVNIVTSARILYNLTGGRNPNVNVEEEEDSEIQTQDQSLRNDAVLRGKYLTIVFLVLNVLFVIQFLAFITVKQLRLWSEDIKKTTEGFEELFRTINKKKFWAKFWRATLYILSTLFLIFFGVLLGRII